MFILKLVTGASSNYRGIENWGLTSPQKYDIIQSEINQKEIKKMKIIMINEECHGFIGLAKDVRAAVNYLVDNDWLDECVMVETEEGIEIPIVERLGENWLEQILNWDIDAFNDFFYNIITLSWEKVVE
jgi:hypothetical protein